MKILPHNSVVMCDIDSTLIMHVNPYHNDPWKLVRVIDPLNPEQFISVVRNEPMIRILREELHAGKLVVVWSRGRYEWAVAVLQALGIDHENIVVMSKPDAYLDDKPCIEWMGPRVYLEPTEIYKNKG